MIKKQNYRPLAKRGNRAGDEDNLLAWMMNRTNSTYDPRTGYTVQFAPTTEGRGYQAMGLPNVPIYERSSNPRARYINQLADQISRQQGIGNNNDYFRMVNIITDAMKDPNNIGPNGELNQYGWAQVAQQQIAGAGSHLDNRKKETAKDIFNTGVQVATLPALGAGFMAAPAETAGSLIGGGLGSVVGAAAGSNMDNPYSGKHYGREIGGFLGGLAGGAYGWRAGMEYDPRQGLLDEINASLQGNKHFSRMPSNAEIEATFPANRTGKVISYDGSTEYMPMPIRPTNTSNTGIPVVDRGRITRLGGGTIYDRLNNRRKYPFGGGMYAPWSVSSPNPSSYAPWRSPEVIPNPSSYAPWENIPEVPNNHGNFSQLYPPVEVPKKSRFDIMKEKLNRTLGMLRYVSPYAVLGYGALNNTEPAYDSEGFHIDRYTGKRIDDDYNAMKAAKQEAKIRETSDALLAGIAPLNDIIISRPTVSTKSSTPAKPATPARADNTAMQTAKTPSTTQKAKEETKPAVKRESAESPKSNNTINTKVTVGNETSVGKNSDYTVVKGDSPWAIANKAGISLNTLYELNPGMEKRGVYVGDKVNLSRNITSDQTIYKAVANDSPWKIAHDHGMTLDEFYKLNPRAKYDKNKKWTGVYVGDEFVVRAKKKFGGVARRRLESAGNLSY